MIFTALLFLLNFILFIYKANIPELTGDEAASFVSLVPFIQNIMVGKFYPSFLVYFHEPLQLITKIPFVFGGLSEGLLRASNIISGILIFIVLKKIWNRFFSKDLISTFILLSLYTFSGYFLLSRMAMDIGVFGLIVCVFIYCSLSLFKARDKNILKSLTALFLAIFVFMDAIFLFPGFMLLLWERRRKSLARYVKPIIYFLLSLSLFFGLWFSAVFIGSYVSHAYDWKAVAPARIFLRGSNFGHLSIAENFESMLLFSHPAFAVFLIIFSLISFFDKKSMIIWKLVLLPIAFLNLIKHPTLHLVFFYPVLVLLAANGWSLLWGKSKIFGKFAIFTGFIAIILVNVQFISSRFSTIQHYGYKIGASFIAEVTNPCETIMTNIDGYVFRLYFGRRYSKEINSSINYAVLVDPDEELKESMRNNNFNLEAINNRTWIYNRSYSGKILSLSKSNGEIFRWNQLMPYINACR